MPTVTIGNTAPIQVRDGADPVNPDPEDREPVVIENGRKDNHTVTEFVLPDDTPLTDALLTIRQAFGGFHSDAPPAFIQSDSPALEMILCAEFGCENAPPPSFKATDLTGKK